jgi:hypothetical protein
MNRRNLFSRLPIAAIFAIISLILTQTRLGRASYAVTPWAILLSLSLTLGFSIYGLTGLFSRERNWILVVSDLFALCVIVYYLLIIFGLKPFHFTL